MKKTRQTFFHFTSVLLACFILTACATEQKQANYDAVAYDVSIQSDNSVEMTNLSLSPSELSANASKSISLQTKVSPVESSTESNLDDEDFADDYGDDESDSIPDPIEPWNRFWFKINDVIIRDIASPVWRGYEKITPVELRHGISNFWHNLLTPVRIVNRILQCEFSMAWVEFDRFVVNTIFGGLGFADIGSTLKPRFTFKSEGADFGNTLAVWGLGEGFYIVLPILGPSTLRDTVGVGVDYVSKPTFWLVEPIGEIDSWIGTLAGVGFAWNDLGSTIKTYETLIESSIEPYAAIRDAYVKMRRGLSR